MIYIRLSTWIDLVLRVCFEPSPTVFTRPNKPVSQTVWFCLLDTTFWQSVNKLNQGLRLKTNVTLQLLLDLHVEYDRPFLHIERSSIEGTVGRLFFSNSRCKKWFMSFTHTDSVMHFWRHFHEKTEILEFNSSGRRYRLYVIRNTLKTTKLTPIGACDKIQMIIYVSYIKHPLK